MAVEPKPHSAAAEEPMAVEPKPHSAAAEEPTMARRPPANRERSPQRDDAGSTEATGSPRPTSKTAAWGPKHSPLPTEGAESHHVEDLLSDLLAHFPNRLRDYCDWLNDEVTWQGRPPAMQEKRIFALRHVEHLSAILGSVEAYYTETSKASRPGNQEAKGRKHTRNRKHTRRTAALSRKQTLQPRFNEIVHMLETALTLVDVHVTETPITKKYQKFYGDKDRATDYHTGDSPDDAIPIIFYKEESNYEKIIENGKEYTYPDGPSVWGRNGTLHTIKVNPDYQYKLGKVLQNTKKPDEGPNARPIQVDINRALTNAKVSMAGKDGDHVRDLGFGGQDAANNYWPLESRINRRPFHGWRTHYGVHYIKKKVDEKDPKTWLLATAAINTLINKYFQIKGFMTKSDEKVPAEGAGEEPAAKSGTSDP
jgi:hypothetical protein